MSYHQTFFQALAVETEEQRWDREFDQLPAQCRRLMVGCPVRFGLELLQNLNVAARIMGPIAVEQFVLDTILKTCSGSWNVTYAEKDSGYVPSPGIRTTLPARGGL